MASTVLDQRARWALTIVIGATLTVTVALLAALTGDQDRWLTFTVFAATTSPVLFGGTWILLPDPDRSDPVTHSEDTVEHEWTQRSASGAFLDLIVALGLALAVQSLLDTPALPLQVFLVLGMADFMVRYGVLRRRAA